jgi:hypothetical protein
MKLRVSTLGTFLFLCLGRDSANLGEFLSMTYEPVSYQGTASQAAEKLLGRGIWAGKVWQGLKPESSFCDVCGTTEVVPFYKTSFRKSISASCLAPASSHNCWN